MNKEEEKLGKLKSGPKRKQGGAGAIGMGRSDLSNKGTGVISRKLPTVDEALRNRERESKKIRKADILSSSFALRARNAKSEK